MSSGRVYCGSSHSRSDTLTTLKSRPLFQISITLHPVQELGRTPAGERRVIPVAGGQFNGERINGTVLPHAGSDLLLLRADGSFQQDARLTLRSDDGALIVMTYRGVRHSSPEVSRRIARGETVPRTDYYLRIAPFFETAARDYAWLNTIVAVGVGERLPNGARYEVYEIL
jgi:hypothetical protein